MGKRGPKLGSKFRCSACGQLGHTVKTHNGSTANAKARNLRRFYRLPWAEYVAWLANGCEICGTAFERTPDVDHDHACDHPGKGSASCRSCVRGLLCRSCNLRVGAYERGLNRDEDIAAYLGSPGQPAIAAQGSLFDEAVTSA